MKICDVCRCPEEKGKKTIEVASIEVSPRRWTGLDLCQGCRARLIQMVTDFLGGHWVEEKHDADFSR